MHMMLATVVMRLGVRPMMVLVAPSTMLLPMLLPMLLCGGNESMVVRVLRGALGVSRLDDVSRFLQQSLTWFASLRLTTHLFEILRFSSDFGMFRVRLFYKYHCFQPPVCAAGKSSGRRMAGTFFFRS
jgi:hypothetical protein